MLAGSSRQVHGPRASVGGAKYGGTLGDLDMSEYLQVMTKQLAEMQAQHQQVMVGAVPAS